MVNLVQTEVARDKSEQKTTENSILASDKSEQKTAEGPICHESQSEEIEKATTLTELSPKETGIQNGEEVSKEEKHSQGSGFSNGLAIIVYSESDNLQQRHSSGTESRESLTCTGGMPSSTSERVPVQQSGQNLSSGSHLLQCDKQIRMPSRYPNKALEDGYNWRKYGQKFVKGNEFIRSYYRCTHPSCRAKRQVECSQDGLVTDTVYIGKHEHFKPQSGSQAAVVSVSPIPPTKTDGGPLVTEVDKSSDAHGPALTSDEAKLTGSTQLPSSPTKNASDGSNSQPVQTKLTRDEVNHDGDLPLKRLKKDVCDVDETLVEKPYGEPRFVGEPRVVVQTMSEVDILQDGYRWRKYGQKLIKGNPNPRSYYRCSSSGCPAKKHVERAPHDAKVVVTTYEGEHDHNMPPARTVTPNRGGATSSMIAPEDETRAKPEEEPAVGLGMVVHASAN